MLFVWYKIMKISEKYLLWKSMSLACWQIFVPSLFVLCAFYICSLYVYYFSPPLLDVFVFCPFLYYQFTLLLSFLHFFLICDHVIQLNILNRAVIPLISKQIHHPSHVIIKTEYFENKVFTQGKMFCCKASIKHCKFSKKLGSVTKKIQHLNRQKYTNILTHSSSK